MVNGFKCGQYGHKFSILDRHMNGTTVKCPICHDCECTITTLVGGKA